MQQVGHFFKYSLLIAIALLWGSQYVFNHVALLSFSPEQVAFFRAAAGAITVWGITWGLALVGKNKRETISWRTHLAFIGIAIFEATLPFYCVVSGQQHVNSSVTAMLMGLIPVFTAFFVLILMRQRSHWGHGLSIVLGLTGLVILLWPDLHSGHVGGNIVGELVVLVAAASFALSLVLIKRLPKLSALATVRWILTYASIELAALMWHDQVTVLAHLHQAVVAVLILGVFCTAIVYLLYVLLIQRVGPQFAALANYCVPVVGVLLGVVLFSDPLYAHTLWAMLVIAIGMVVSDLPSWFKGCCKIA